MGPGGLSYAVSLASIAHDRTGGGRQRGCAGLDGLGREEVRALRARLRHAVNRYRLTTGHQAYPGEMRKALGPLAGAAKELRRHPGSMALARRLGHLLANHDRASSLVVREHVIDALGGPHFARLRAEMVGGLVGAGEVERQRAANRYDALLRQRNRRKRLLRESIDRMVFAGGGVLMGRDLVTLDRLGRCADVSSVPAGLGKDPALVQLLLDVLPVWQAVTGRKGTPQPGNGEGSGEQKVAPMQSWLEGVFSRALGIDGPPAPTVARWVWKLTRTT